MCGSPGYNRFMLEIIPQRFIEKISPEPNSGCWIWCAARLPFGYGTVKVSGRPKVAHRAVWELLFGPIPGGKKILHKCDTPSCVNPAHLFMGTQADNVADMISKGRRRIAGRKPGSGSRFCFKGHDKLAPGGAYKTGKCRRCAVERYLPKNRHFVKF